MQVSGVGDGAVEVGHREGGALGGMEEVRLERRGETQGLGYLNWREEFCSRKMI